ncbi:MAG TPA: prepilin peptidase [Armatimonadota bacterium]|nr:prepilin peptidase [Armatimonadota bacterium]
MLSNTNCLTALNALLIGGLVLAVACDIRSRRIPNWITLPLMLCGICLNTAASGWSGLGESLGGLVLGMALLLPIWLAGGTGAGDVKLLAMIGALRGMAFALWTGLFGAVAGGILAFIAILFRKGGGKILRNVWAHIYRFTVLQTPGAIQPTDSSFRMSYALAIALGALAAALYR